MAAKDMYADLEKIEARGKRKKEKSKGFFSSFGNKDEPEPEESPELEVKPEPAAPAKEPMFSKREEPHSAAPAPEPVAQKAQVAHVPAPEPVIPKTQQTHQPAPPIKHETESPKPATKSVEPSKPVQKPAETKQKSSWMPLTGGKLNQAEEDLLAYKKWLNKGYKSGVLTKEQCTTMVRAKMIELGLAPPE